MIFDLDPPGEFEVARSTAFLVKELLEEVGLVPFVMTTGSRGLHVVTPLDRSAHFDEIARLRQGPGAATGRTAPRHADNRDAEGRARRSACSWTTCATDTRATGVAPYSVRPRPGAPVATPLTWDELKDPDLRSNTYNLRNIWDRLDKVGDPWRGMMRNARGLKEPRRKLDEIGRR